MTNHYCVCGFGTEYDNVWVKHLRLRGVHYSLTKAEYERKYPPKVARPTHARRVITEHNASVAAPLSVTIDTEAPRKQSSRDDVDALGELK
jgi:hypothetical protein